MTADTARQQAEEKFGPGIIESVLERIGLAATAKAVFGDPIDRDGTTIIPVAHVRMGIGFGRGHGKGGKDDDEGEGQGGGGGVQTIPVGYIELRNGEASFHRISPSRKLAALAVIGGTIVLTLGMIGAAWGNLGGRTDRR